MKFVSDRGNVFRSRNVYCNVKRYTSVVKKKRHVHISRCCIEICATFLECTFRSELPFRRFISLHFREARRAYTFAKSVGHDVSIYE